MPRALGLGVWSIIAVLSSAGASAQGEPVGTRDASPPPQLLGGPHKSAVVSEVRLASGQTVRVFRLGPASGKNPYAPKPVDPKTHRIGLHIPHTLPMPSDLGRPAPKVVTHRHDGAAHGHLVRSPLD